MSSNDEIILESNVALQKSKLWQLQKEFFSEKGIEAWNREVPFYITSNPYIANAYAQIICRFMQDHLSKRTYDPLQPFYILELGAGSGTFSFYLLKKLSELISTLALMKINFVYVMSDISLKNIDYWQNHPVLQNYIQQGRLDFAQYNMELDEIILLRNSGVRLGADNFKKTANPIIVIANYAFDSVAQDVFLIKNDEFAEGRVTLKTKSDNFDNETVKNIADITAEFSYQPASLPYYAEAEVDAVLSYYVRQNNEIKLLFPIAALRCIENLRKLSDNKLLLLATDKGYSNHVTEHNSADPFIAWHGSFSLMVNFHVISQYFRKCGGDSYSQKIQQDICSCAFILGDTFDNLISTRYALESYFDQFGPGNLFNLYRNFNATKNQLDLHSIISFLNAASWDPQIFDDTINQIVNLINHTSVITIKDLQSILPKIAENFYALPGKVNTLTNIGYLLQVLGNFKAALYYYQQSLGYEIQHCNTYYFMALCYYQLKDYSAALSCCKTAEKIEPHNIVIKGWSEKIRLECSNT